MSSRMSISPIHNSSNSDNSSNSGFFFK
jgi:hypothetical protein